MDVDLAVPVETIAAFVEETQNAPIVIGSRSIEGAKRSGEPLSRRIGGKVIQPRDAPGSGPVRCRYTVRIQGVQGLRGGVAIRGTTSGRIRL